MENSLHRRRRELYCGVTKRPGKKDRSSEHAFVSPLDHPNVNHGAFSKFDGADRNGENTVRFGESTDMRRAVVFHGVCPTV